MAPNFSLALAEQIDRETRKMWGGDRPYISTRRGEGKSTRNDRIKSDYQKGAHVAFLMRHYDLSASRIREILKD
jgi:Mor family transcriptional regulator